MNDFQKAQAAKILGCYGINPADIQKAAAEEAALKKSEEAGAEAGKEGEGTQEGKEEGAAEEAK